MGLLCNSEGAAYTDYTRLTLNGYSNCSVTNTEISSSSIAVLSLRTLDKKYYSDIDSADIQINCQPLVWLYAVIGLCCLIAIVFISLVLIASAYVCVRKTFKSQNSVAYVQLDEEGDDLLNAAGDAARDKPNFPA